MAPKESKFRLTVSRGSTKGAEFILCEGENMLGRWDSSLGSFPGVDLEGHDPDALVSRRHARLLVDGDQASLEDLGSMNGTYINRSKRLEKGDVKPLKIGDEIVVGKTFLKFCED